MGSRPAKGTIVQSLMLLPHMKTSEVQNVDLIYSSPTMCFMNLWVNAGLETGEQEKVYVCEYFMTLEADKHIQNRPPASGIFSHLTIVLKMRFLVYSLT